MNGTKEYFEGIKDYLEELLPTYDWTSEFWNWQKRVDNLNMKYDFTFKVFHGITKLVLIDEDEDFVIKIPFTRADNTRPLCEDYCNREENLYYSAELNNVEDYFAETKKIGVLSNGYPIYAQVRVSPLEVEYEDGSITSYRDFTDNEIELGEAYSQRLFYPTEDEDSSGSFINEVFSECEEVLGWIADFISWYGEDEFNCLMTFALDYEISDLHSSNLGYVNNRPIILDYCG